MSQSLPPDRTGPAGPEDLSLSPDTTRPQDSDEAVLLACVPDACFVLAQDGRLTCANPAAENLLRRLSGVSGSLLGHSLWSECPEVADSAFASQCKEATVSRLPLQKETFYPTLKHWFSVCVTPVAGRLCVVLRDTGTQSSHQRESAGGVEHAGGTVAWDALIVQLGREARAARIAICEALRVAGCCAASEEAQRACAVAEQAVQAFSSHLEQALTTSTPASEQQQRVNLAALVAATLANPLPAEPGRCNLVIDFPPEPVWVDVLPREIESALRKLVRDASHLNDPRDTLRLTIEREGTDVVLRVRPEGLRQETQSPSPADLNHRE